MCNKKWTKEAVNQEAKKYKTRMQFKNCNQSAYKKARKLGILDKVCSHMMEVKKPAGYWTKEKIEEEAKQFRTIKEFCMNSPSAYHASKRQGLIIKMSAENKKKVNWSKSLILDEVKKYKNKGELRSKNSGAYQKALKLMKEDPEVARIIQKLGKKG